MPPRRSRFSSFSLAMACCAVASAIAACGGGSGGLATGSIAPYSPANGFYPFGYQTIAVSETDYRVVSSGSATASKSRLEKIALTRAAELGVEKKKRFLKVGAVTHGVACSKKVAATHKGLASPGSARATVTLDVTYADTAVDASYRDVKASFDEYKAAMDADTADADAAQAQDLAAQCGQT
jgi:hypothetical protein